MVFLSIIEGVRARRNPGLWDGQQGLCPTEFFMPSLDVSFSDSQRPPCTTWEVTSIFTMVGSAVSAVQYYGRGRFADYRSWENQCDPGELD